MKFLKKFMRGRNGIDQLSLSLIILSLTLIVLHKLFKVNLFYYISLLNVIFAYFRVFSKNLSVRQEENQKFLELSYPIRKKVKLSLSRLADLKDYKYFKCSACNQTIRVPRKKGKISITCPKCKNKMIRRT